MPIDKCLFPAAGYGTRFLPATKATPKEMLPILTKPGKNTEVQITDALLTQAQRGMVLGYKFKGTRFDCGSVEGFVAATNYFFEKSKG